jgi:hypothetical protein
MIKLILTFFLILGILYIYCKISNKESFDNWVSEQHCIDSCIVDKINTPSFKMEDANTDCRTTCEDNCKDKKCSYIDVLNLKKSPPGKIHNERVTINEASIHITWFKPKTSIEHPILRYICVIENDEDKSIELEIPNNSNTNLMEHYLRGLKKDTLYNIKLYSENDNGLSLPKIIQRIRLKPKNQKQELEKKRQLQWKKKGGDFSKIISKLSEKKNIKSFLLKLLE